MEVNVDISGNEMDNTINVEDKLEEPKRGMVFDNTDEVMDYYKRYANELGFAVIRRSLSKGDDGESKYVTFACSRAGKSKSTSRKFFHTHPSTKTDCKAVLRVTLCPDKKWRVSSIRTDHNHGLSSDKSHFDGSNRMISSHVERKLEINDKAGIRVNKNFNSIAVEAGGHKNVRFLEKDCINYIVKVRRLRLGEGDASAIQTYFLKMQANDSNFFYIMDSDDEGRLRNAFWADARSRAACKEFGDVVYFDTTYLTNKYDIPFAPFVGVNHHGHSTLLGCGLISNENIETFIWLFQSWLTCMSNCAPNAIITDQDKVMQKAIEIVFPNARHRWCLWQILKKLPEKLRGYKQYESIKCALQSAVYDSLTHYEFEEHWSKMIGNYNLDTNEWLHSLYNERGRWVPVFVKNTFWAGMSTSERSESMNAFFDGYVKPKTTLKQFVEQYENALRSMVKKESHEDFNSFNSLVPCMTHYAMEKQFQDAYTTAKFKEFQHELMGKIYCELSLIKDSLACSEYEIYEDLKAGESERRATFKVFLTHDGCDIQCNCHLFEFRGILCRHTISVLIHKQIIRAPEKYIIQRWRKDVKRGHTKVKISYNNWSVKPKACRFDRMCTTFCEVADLATDSEDKTKMVMDCMDELKEKLKRDECICESSQPTTIMSGEATNGYIDVNPISKESRNILDPMAVPSKGHLPFKRKQSKGEQVVKRTKEKKRMMENKEKNADDIKLDKDSHMIGKGVDNYDVATGSKVDEFGTQESIILKDSHMIGKGVDNYDVATGSKVDVFGTQESIILKDSKIESHGMRIGVNNVEIPKAPHYPYWWGFNHPMQPSNNLQLNDVGQCLQADDGDKSLQGDDKYHIVD